MASKLDFYNLNTSNRTVYINDEIYTEIARDITLFSLFTYAEDSGEICVIRASGSTICSYF